jgi:glycerate 2-kinase
LRREGVEPVGMARGSAQAMTRTRGVKRDALLAVQAALEAAHPSLLVRKALRLEGDNMKVDGFSCDLKAYRQVVLVGGGKASGLMAVEAERILGRRLSRGIVIIPEYQRSLPRLRRVKFAKSTHPLPSEKGAMAVRRMLHALRDVTREDLVIVLISGGGSALMPSPLDGLTVEELDRTTSLILKAGADIKEINCVRKHLSQIAGGRLVERTAGAEVLTLIISDVVGDDISSVASGPTVADPTTFDDARRILEARKVWRKIPASVRAAIKSGMEGKIRETPKPGDPIFERVSNIVLGSNAVACSAAEKSLEASGYQVSVVGSVTGEARAVGKRLARLALTEGVGRRALVWGGETTVTVRGGGVGGRNQELALAAAIELKGSSDTAVVSFGTDGVDGSTNAAGAYADSRTCDRAEALGLDPRSFLNDNDSNTFFRALGDLVVTGPTGTNVNDVMMALRV